MADRVPDYQPEQLIPGTVYRVHRVLGAGGMGTVYDVEDTSVGRRYVLKTLHGDLSERADLAMRLSREARALAKLQHPNIVEVYTSGTTQDKLKLPFYVMERLQGQSLRMVIERKGRLTFEQACDITIDLLDALDHAHEFGIVHRDVKPDNIFITRGRDGRSLAKLLDFGIIKLAGASQLTGGRFIGTFRYAPPEQILGREVTAQSDLYSAALVLYEMIAGRGPFDNFTDQVEIGRAQIEMPAPPISSFAHVPPELDALLLAALDKNPANRPKDAFAFATALREVKRKRVPSADVGQLPTVEGVVSQSGPSSGNIMRAASNTSASTKVVDFAATRVDPPAVASTHVSAGGATVDYGAGRQPIFSTQGVVAPPAMTQASASEPVPLVHPHVPVPRNVPPNAGLTLPLAARSVALPEQRAREAETYRAPNPQPRPGGGGVWALGLVAGVMLAAALGLLGLVLWKHSHERPKAAALLPPPVTAVTVATTGPTPVPVPVETTVPSATATIPVPRPTETAKIPSTVTTATIRPSATAHPTSPSATASQVAAPPPAATPPPTADVSVHRPGSGL